MYCLLISQIIFDRCANINRMRMFCKHWGGNVQETGPIMLEGDRWWVLFWQIQCVTHWSISARLPGRSRQDTLIPLPQRNTESFIRCYKSEPDSMRLFGTVNQLIVSAGVQNFRKAQTEVFLNKLIILNYSRDFLSFVLECWTFSLCRSIRCQSLIYTFFYITI